MSASEEGEPQSPQDTPSPSPSPSPRESSPGLPVSPQPPRPQLSPRSVEQDPRTTTTSAPTISRPPSRPPGRAPGMSPWVPPPQWPPAEPPQWQGGWPPPAWDLQSQQDALRMAGMYPPGSFPLPSPSWPLGGASSFSSDTSTAFTFTRPGQSHPREHLLQRAVQPGFSSHHSDPRDLLSAPSGPQDIKPETGLSSLSSFSAPSTSASVHSSSSISPRGPTQITRQTPEPGEVTIEKSEQTWEGAPHTPGPSAAWAPRPTQDPQRPPPRRSRMRDLVSSAVRSALSNPSLEDEAERFSDQMGSTFASTLGALVKKEK